MVYNHKSNKEQRSIKLSDGILFFIAFYFGEIIIHTGICYCKKNIMRN